MTKEDLDNLQDMYYRALAAAKGMGEYVDPKAQAKADTLKKLIDLFSDEDLEK